MSAAAAAVEAVACADKSVAASIFAGMMTAGDRQLHAHYMARL